MLYLFVFKSDAKKKIKDQKKMLLCNIENKKTCLKVVELVARGYVINRAYPNLFQNL